MAHTSYNCLALSSDQRRAEAPIATAPPELMDWACARGRWAAQNLYQEHARGGGSIVEQKTRQPIRVFCLWPILSKKVFLAGEKIFSAPPVHFARADVRDHVESQEIDHRASYVSY